MKNMNKYFLILISVIAFSSCKMADFDRYPGESMDEYPESIWGYFEAKYGFGTEGDAIPAGALINRDTAILKNLVREKEINFTLSDSIVFSRYKKYHFISFRSFDEEKGFHWNVFPVKIGSDEFSVYHFYTDDDAAEELSNLMEPVMEGSKVLKMNEKTYYKFCKKWMPQLEPQIFERKK